MGASTIAALGTTLGVYASRVPVEPRSRIKDRQIIADAKPLLEKMELNVPDLRTADLDDLPAAATPAIGGGYVPPPFALAARTPDDATRALECLTQAVYYEAGNEPLDGQRAVAQVVLNRVRDRAFPASVCGVVYQGSHRRTGCQFTFTCDGSLRRRPVPSLWTRAQAVAQAALGGEVYAPVGSATHYHANYVSPWWVPSLTRIGSVGAHIFYRWRGALERALTFRQSYAGAEPGAASSAPMAAAAQLEADDGPAVRVHRAGAPATAAVTVQGVRIHRRDLPVAATPIDDTADRLEVVDGAVIAAESDPV
ncbi:cell wall hydrolase [Sphingomonas lenta]|uniref:Cell wall hydrolase n=2 Tax=Sphingomonas lenta TaxID=1141887 RepID=A0A2A2SDT5_9SPHN|nr:cell wall hydrolase [Sphingomonas lenta]